MKKALFSLTLLLAIALLMSGCNADKVYYHHNGHVKYTYKRRNSPWHTSLGSGYDKHAKRTMRHWRQNVDRRP